MASREVQIAGTGANATIREPWVVAVLTLVTFGIYGLVWYYKINRELRDLGRARGTDELGTSPGKSLLAVTLGAIPLLIPLIISYVNTGKRIQAAERMAGVEPLLNGWLAVVMGVLGLTPLLF